MTSLEQRFPTLAYLASAHGNQGEGVHRDAFNAIQKMKQDEERLAQYRAVIDAAAALAT